jgi:predicted transposase YdaD
MTTFGHVYVQWMETMYDKKITDKALADMVLKPLSGLTLSHSLRGLIRRLAVELRRERKENASLRQTIINAHMAGGR